MEYDYDDEPQSGYATGAAGGGYDEEHEQTQEHDEEEQPENGAAGEGEEEEEEEEDDDDEDDEDDEDEEDERRSRKRIKRKRRDPVSRFIDEEAEVDDDEDDIDDDIEEEAGFNFIDRSGEHDDEDAVRRGIRDLHRKRLDEGDEQSPEQIAQALKGRYGGRSANRYTGDMNEIPQRLLMPSVHDVFLWQVRVKAGRERDIVFSLMRKSIDVEFTANPLQIASAFQRDSLPGMIYVEAQSAASVLQACNGLVGVYPSRGVHLVPIEERAALLQIKKQEINVTPGSWVRVRRGKYQGDLGQVVDVTDNGEDVGLKLVPRIDLNPKDEGSSDPSKKRKKAVPVGGIRPPQRLFNYEEVVKVYGRQAVVRRGQVYVFQGDTYKDGFMEKDFKLSGLILEEVNPSLDEITQFSRRGGEAGDIDTSVDLSIIAEASRKAAVLVLQPGDHVEVFEGEQAGMHGVVEEINQDVVTITASGGLGGADGKVVELEGQKVDLPARSVRKRFKAGDHVKVMAGKNRDETGLVVSVVDNVVTFISDMSMQEVSVFSKDLREAAEVGSSTNVVGDYELHDLVQLDAQTVGVIFKTERDSFRVLDQNEQVRLVQPHQISMRKNSERAIATDAEGHEIRVGDNMKESGGEGRKGRVLHIHQSFFAFLHNREINENGGVFVSKTRSLVSQAPKGLPIGAGGKLPSGGDLSKMNPALMAPPGGMVGSGAMGRGPRDRDIGLHIVVIKGPHKGYNGIIVDTNGTLARVELSTNNKMISIDKSKLHRKLPNGRHEGLNVRSGGFGRGGGPGGFARGGGQGDNEPFGSGGRTPGWGGGLASRTPNPYSDSRTPAWNASSRTPNPYSDSRTPAWNASSRTPNPYAMNNSQTPAWNAHSKTPNPYANPAAGGQTPGRPAWGGATPGRPAGNATNTWGGATPGRPTGSTVNTWGGATPGRPTGGAGGWGDGGATGSWSAETPAAYSAPTPAAGGAYSSAPTPGMYGAAPTPAFTPGMGVGAPVTPAAWDGGPGWDSGETQQEGDGELASDWIYDPLFASVFTRLIVRIEGTRLDQYLDGQFEGKQGKIIAGQKSAEIYDQTALVEFEDDKGIKSSRSMLTKYLSPIQPLKMNDECLVLGGQYKGHVATVRGAPEEDPQGKIVVSLRDGVWEELSKGSLALLAQQERSSS